MLTQKYEARSFNRGNHNEFRNKLTKTEYYLCSCFSLSVPAVVAAVRLSPEAPDAEKDACRDLQLITTEKLLFTGCKNNAPLKPNLPQNPLGQEQQTLIRTEQMQQNHFLNKVGEKDFSFSAVKQQI